MAGQRLPGRWASHLQVWYGFRNSLRSMHVPLDPGLAVYQDPHGPQNWRSDLPSWRVQAIAFLGEKLVNTGVAVDFSDSKYRSLVVVSGWGRNSVNVEVRFTGPTAEQLDEALGYTAALIGLLPELEDVERAYLDGTLPEDHDGDPCTVCGLCQVCKGCAHTTVINGSGARLDVTE